VTWSGLPGKLSSERQLDFETSVKPLTLAAGIVSFLAGAALTLVVIRALEIGRPELAFVVGAILGTGIGAVAHHRQKGNNTGAVKTALGIALAATAVAFGLLVHFAFGVFAYPEVSIPIAGIGSFVFPFVLFNTMWEALSKTPKG
jgi:MFS family permease